MIEIDPDDRAGTPRWPISAAARANWNIAGIYAAVSNNLMAAHCGRNGSEPMPASKFFALVAPLYVELRWAIDRVHALETRRHRDPLAAKVEKLIEALGGLPDEPPAAPQSKEETDAE